MNGGDVHENFRVSNGDGYRSDGKGSHDGGANPAR